MCQKERFSHDLEMETCKQNRKKKRTEIERFDWFIERIQTRVAEKTSCPKNCLKLNQYFALTSYCNTIGQSNNAFSILGFFGGKTKSPCFDLFIHWLIKQITNTYRNHFSRSYENRSIQFIKPVAFSSLVAYPWRRGRRGPNSNISIR